MSESSKMGLFGSKDETKELKKETPGKQESPERYAPYCIDSDSETYDTEALSIMDINDIIGVQSEPIGDSTLESEIDALSQIITEPKAGPASKGESCQNDPNAKPAQRSNSEFDHETAQPVQDFISHKDSYDVGINESKHLEGISISMDASNPVQLVDASEGLVTNEVKDIIETRSVNESSNLNHDTEDHVRLYSTDCISTVFTDKSSITKDSLPIEGTTSTVVQPSSTKPLAHIRDVNINKMDGRTNPEDESANDGSVSSALESGNNITNIGSISKSLQLIGEAYTSEDSQETNSNENETEDLLPATAEDSTKTSNSNDAVVLEEKISQDNEGSFMDVEEEPVKTEESSVVNDDEASENLQQDLTESIECSVTVANAESESMAVLYSPDSKDNSEPPETEEAEEKVDKPGEAEVMSEINKELDAETERALGQTPIGDVNINTMKENERTDTDTENRMIEDTSPDRNKTMDAQSVVDSEESSSPPPDQDKIEERSCEQLLVAANSPIIEADLLKKDPLEENNLPVQHSTRVDNESLDEEMQENNIVEEINTTKDTINNVVEGMETDYSLSSKHIETAPTSDPEEKEFPVDIDSPQAEENVLQRPLPDTSTQEILRSVLLNPKDSEKLEEADCPSTIVEEKDIEHGSKSSEKIVEADESPCADNSEINADVIEVKSVPSENDSEMINTESLPEQLEEAIEEISPSMKISDVPKESDDSYTADLPQSMSVSIADSQDPTIPTNSQDENDEEEPEVKAETTIENVPTSSDTTSTLKQGNVDLEEKCEENQTNVASVEASEETPADIQLNKGLYNDLDNGTGQVQALELDNLPITDDTGQSEENTDAPDITTPLQNERIIGEEKNEQEIPNDSPQATEEEENKTDEIKDDPVEPLVEVEQEEEEVADEMNLTLEETDLQLETGVDSTWTDSEKIDEKRSDEDVEKLEEKISVVPEEKDQDTMDIAEITQVASASEDTGTCVVHSDVDLSEDKQLSNDSKGDDNAENLKSILGSTGDVVQLLSEEQSQNSQDIMSSILDDVNDVADLKNILQTDSVENEVEEVLQNSTELVETEMKELSEKPSEDSGEMMEQQLEDHITPQNIDPFEDILGLEVPREEETESKDVPEDYIADVISTCVEGASNDSPEEKAIAEAVDEKIVEAESDELDMKEDTILDVTTKNTDQIVEQKEIESDNGLQEADMEMEFTENPLESMEDLIEEESSKLEIDGRLLLENNDQAEGSNDLPMEISQPNSEISELESAVKFLQESEEQAMDSPLVLSPKLVESVVQNISKQADAGLFVPDEVICADANELVEDLGDIATDSISISEAEIITEAAKLESERKLAEQSKLEASSSGIETNVLEELEDFEKREEERIGEMSLERIEGPEMPFVEETEEVKKDVSNNKDASLLEIVEKKDVINVESSSKAEHVLQEDKFQGEAITLPKIMERVQKISESKVSILEERLKEPPQIEIPMTEITRICDVPTTPKNNLLIPKDAKLGAYQRMLDSPKASDKTETKNVETPRKDIEKHDFDNVGSPRIILKIAKSAITDCAEPRSPKSPKIRSATNSPNPEDSPGQKLGKIKLKLSRGGHPSIISNENIEETSQWHTEGSALSPIGMKIKLSKTGDASIVPSEKHDNPDDLKDVKHKYEETKRTESPIGMKIKLSKSGDASIVQQDCKESAVKHKDKLDSTQDSPKRTDSPIGMKIKLSKTGDASIIPPEKPEGYDDGSSKSKDRMEGSQKHPKRTDSPLGVKIKLSKTGDASIVSSEVSEDLRDTPEIMKRTDSPVGMKLKISKTKGGSSSFIPVETDDMKDKLDIPEIPKRTESPLGMKIKLSRTGDASIIHTEMADDTKKMEGPYEMPKQLDSPGGTRIKQFQESERAQEGGKEKLESTIGMKIKLSKTGDASIIPPDNDIEEQKLKDPQLDIPKRTDSPIGMKIKFSKTGDPSIVQNEEDFAGRVRKAEMEQQRTIDSSLGMKIKLSKSGDASIMEPEKREKTQKRRENDTSLEMKIKLSKTGHPTIIPPEAHGEFLHKAKDSTESSYMEYKEAQPHKDPNLKLMKTSGHSGIVGGRSELTIEPVQMQGKKLENALETSQKRKDVTISPIELKKSKLEAQLSHILPEVTIQPVMSRDQKQLVFDPKTSLISRQQMNVISQEISITQVRPTKPADMSMSDKLKDILSKNAVGSPIGSDCEIIEHRPELIIVNENSNSSQDVMIIDEVPPMRMPDSAKTPKKRGRPRRNPVPPRMVHQPNQMMMPRDPLALDDVPQVAQFEQRENERPKRTCRSQKSYAPPKRGRGRGRGKRKLDAADFAGGKRARIDQDLTAIENSTMSVITLDGTEGPQDMSKNSSELYKALKQPPMDRKGMNTLRSFDDPSLLAMRNESGMPMQLDPALMQSVQEGMCKTMPKLIITPTMLDSKGSGKGSVSEIILGKERKMEDKSPEGGKNMMSDGKCMLVPPGHSNWLTPTSKKQMEAATRNETVSTVQVIDEDTRMSAESGSRSQTPARNIPVPASETIINEESQGSVLSTATTESEKVKVKNRRMEINFDPDEGPFTVDKIAEYEWPLDRKGETFMIQEQISQYLGVKSFKRKYPDLKRRMVDMEERNYLRENGLVSEAMCDMGLTAVCSSEVLDVMCSDFPDQYEEYRKHMREKQVKEHSKKQKELTAAANAEKNRIDLAEMAVQSAVSWNISLNKARRETRKCSLDLQTFTIHVPKKEQKVEERRASHYPVALIPGQYTDYYREYTPAELRYYPLNTVLYGPMRPNMRKFDSQSEGSQSDSDSDSSSDDSSSSSSEETQDTEESQSTMDDVDMELNNQKDEVKLKCKMCLKSTNKHGKSEILIQCGTCNGNVHPSCIDLTLDTVPHIQSYAWQCTDCKTCSQCHDPANEDKMLFCDMCDRGYHIYCVGLRRVPQGRWHCQECAVCANCGSREPGGVNSDRNSVAQWQHEYKKGDKNTRVYVSTLCVPCSKLWRKGRYCPHCSRCHTATRLDQEPNLVHCSACDKYLHLGCVETKGVLFDKKNYLCDFCSPNRQQTLKPLASKIFKT